MGKILSIFTMLFITIICISAYKDGQSGYAVYCGIGFSIMLAVGIIMRFSKHKKA